jgi:hypothetical protein
VVAISTPKTPALTELEATLFRLVDALLEHGRNYPREDEGWVVYTPSVVVASAQEIIADPISYSLKRGIRGLGKVTVSLYGSEALREIAERVCVAGAGGPSVRMPHVNDALSGVGESAPF